MRCLAAGIRLSTGSRAVLLDLEQQVGGIVGGHPRQHRRHLLVGALAQELDLVLVVELLEHVGLELLVVPDRLEDLLALLVRGRLDKVGDLGRMQSREPARGELQPGGRYMADERLHLGPGDELAVLVVVPRNRRGRKRHSRGRRLGSIPATRQTSSWHTISTSRAVTSRAVSTLIRLRSSTSERQQHLTGPRVRTAPGSASSSRCAHASGPSWRDAVDRDEHLTTADARQQTDHGRQRISEVEPSNHIVYSSETLSGGIEQRTAGDRGDVNDGVGHRSLGGRLARFAVYAARIRAASTAALRALSTPTHATGTPGGICGDREQAHRDRRRPRCGSSAARRSRAGRCARRPPPGGRPTAPPRR